MKIQRLVEHGKREFMISEREGTKSKEEDSRVVDLLWALELEVGVS